MSVNIISLNQIINLFSSFAQQHFFIKDFGYGPTSDIGTSRQMEFPYLWLSLDQQSSISVVNKTAIPRYGITILLMDKINIQQNYLDINGVNSDNSQEILSDTLQCLQDLITEIEVNWGNFGLKIDGDVSCFPAVDETPDKVCGWVGQFPMKVRHSNCITPMGNIMQTNLSPINPFTQYLTCDTLPSCPTIINIENQLSGLTFSALTCNTLSGCTIIQDLQDGEITGATFTSQGVLTLQNASSPITITGFTTCDTLSGCTIIQDLQNGVITGGTFSQGTLQLFNGISPIIISGFPTSEVYTTGGTITYTNSNGVLDLFDTSGNTISITGLTDVYTTGGTYSNGTITLDRNDGFSYNIGGLFTGYTNVVNTIQTGTGLSGNTTTGNITLINTAPDQIVSLSNGTGISTSGTYPNFTITNTLPDQIVSLSGGTGIITGGTYPNFTITNSAPDQIVSLSNGTGISTSGTYPNFTITNTAPNQIISLSGGTGIITGGTYPNFTITNTLPDQIVSLSGGTGILTGGTYPNFTITNSAPDQVVSLSGLTGISTGGSYPNFTITNTAPNQIVSISGGTGILTGGTYPNFTITNSAPDQVVSITGGANISATGTYPNFTIAATGLTDYFVTGGTFSTSGGTLTLNRQNGSVSITGFTSNIGNFGITIDGGGSAITTGIKGSVVVPYACYITSWSVVSDVSGSIVVDVWKGASPYTIPTSAAQSIAGSEKPTLSSQQINTDLNLTTWTTPLVVGNVLVFNVDSSSTLTRATIQINVIKL